MSWKIDKLELDNHFLVTVKMEEGTHVVACKFLDLKDLKKITSFTGTEIIDPNSSETYQEGDKILLVLASHYGNPLNTATIPTNRQVMGVIEMKNICMVLVHKNDIGDYHIRRVKRTTSKVSEVYPYCEGCLDSNL